MEKTYHTSFSKRIAELLNKEAQTMSTFEKYTDRHAVAKAIHSFLVSNDSIHMLSANSDDVLYEQIENNEETYQLFINAICIVCLDDYLDFYYFKKPWCSPDCYFPNKTRTVYEILDLLEAHTKEELVAIMLDATLSSEQTDMASA